MNPDYVKRSKFVIAVITLAFSVAISLVFLVFAFFQKAEADQARRIAIELRKEAEQQLMIAEEFRLMAEAARKDLEACRGN